MRARFLLNLIFIFSILETRSSFALSLEEAMQMAFAQAPHLEASEKLNQISKSDLWRHFIPNSPSFQYSRIDSDSTDSFALTQNLGFPGKTFFEHPLYQANSRQAQAELEANRYDLSQTILQSYLDCALADENNRLLEKNVENAEMLTKTMTSRYESGASSMPELISSELQVRQLRSDLSLSQDKKKNSCQKLSALLGKELPLDEKYALPDDLPQEVLDRIGVAESADELRAKADLQKAQAVYKTAWVNGLPDLSFNYSRNHYRIEMASPNGDTWTHSYGISIATPLFYFFHENAENRKTKNQAIIDQYQAQLRLITGKASHQDAALEYKRSKKRLTELRNKDLAMAEALVESTLSAYKTAKLGFAELVMAQKTLSDLKTQDLQLRVSVISSHLRCLQDCYEK
ncbi:MAG: TolC family protein [Deltaproteobacteria bacterium]|nr:TolC family protein [Deltaproteobacteria bacterium]